MIDDDFTFGASVWSTPNVPAHLPNITTSFPSLQSPSPSPALSQDILDDYDDSEFHTPPQTQNPSITQDDDFGDFGDFGQVENLEGGRDFAHYADFGQDMDFSEDVNFHQEPIPGPSQTVFWEPLRLNPLPSIEELEKHINRILDPVWIRDISSLTTDEDIRQVEGVSQILVTLESRGFYTMLMDSPPLMESINWTRSRVRQQHLIALGLPVNLDEILPHASSKPLPPLQISTRPMSAPPGPRNGPMQSAPPSRTNSRAGTPIAGTPQTSTRPGSSTLSQLGHGPKHQLNEKKVEELLKFDTDQLILLPLGKLERCLADLRTETTNASSSLTHLLQTRDALQQDSETYNKLIAELVTEAQKNSSGQSRTGVRRSGTLR